MSRRVWFVLHPAVSKGLRYKLGHPKNRLGLRPVKGMLFCKPQSHASNLNRASLQLSQPPGSHDRNLLRGVRVQKHSQDQPNQPLLLQLQMQQSQCKMLYRRGHRIQFHSHSPLHRRRENQRGYQKDRRRGQTFDQPFEGDHFISTVARDGRDLRNQPGEGGFVFCVPGLFCGYERGEIETRR